MKLDKLINILFILYICSIIIYYFLIILNEANWNLILLSQHWFKALFMLIISVLFKSFFVICCFIIIKIAIRHYNKDLNKQEINIEKTFNYFREILKDASPAVISLVHTYEVDQKISVISILLSLKLKGVIEITNEEIFINNDKVNNLTKTEQIVFDMILNKDFNNENKLKELENYIIKETYDLNYFKEKSFNSIDFFKRLSKLKKFGPLFLFTIIFSYVINIFLNIISPDQIPQTFKIIYMVLIVIIVLSMFILLGFIPILLTIYISVYIFKVTTKKHFRTEEGEMLNEKINGLKNYLTDFSNLKEKDIKYIKLWDEYLIYSVIFGVNDKVVKNIYNLIQNNYTK